MLPNFIITFRETLEAALIIGVIIGYLYKTKQIQYIKTVYYGIAAGILASILGAIIFANIAGGFNGKIEEIFEGITMMIGAILLTTMILWMIKQHSVANQLREKVQNNINKTSRAGLFFLAFVSILREGIETVIFLNAATIVSPENNIAGAILGVVLAIILGYIIFATTIMINLKRFFFVTSALLILFAAGLFAHAIHEFQEAGVVPIIIEHVWDINPEKINDVYPLWHEKGHIGSVLKGLLGYNGNPSLLEIVTYIIYLFFAIGAWKISLNKKVKPTVENKTE